MQRGKNPEALHLRRSVQAVSGLGFHRGCPVPQEGIEMLRGVVFQSSGGTVSNIIQGCREVPAFREMSCVGRVVLLQTKVGEPCGRRYQVSVTVDKSRQDYPP